MADARRTRWVAHDVYFLDSPLGEEVFDRFGAAGVALWYGFIASCKKNHIEGRVTFASDVEALTLLGLPGMDLTGPDGEPFTLQEFFTLLGRHKVTRRTSRGRLVQVVCTRWERWQNAGRSYRAAEQKARSRATFTEPEPGQSDDETSPDTDTDTDTEETPLPPDGGDEDAKVDEAFDAFWSAYPARNGRKVGKKITRRRFTALSWEQRRRAYRGAVNVARADQLPKDPERFLKRNQAGEYPFDDWQTAPTAGRDGRPIGDPVAAARHWGRVLAEADGASGPGEVEALAARQWPDNTAAVSACVQAFREAV